MAKITIDLDIDQTVELVRQDLMDSYDTLDMGGDEEAFLEMKEALSRVIKYYSTLEQTDEWEERIKND